MTCPPARANGGLSRKWWNEGHVDLRESLVGDQVLAQAVEDAIDTAIENGDDVGTAAVTAVRDELRRQGQEARRG